MNITKYKKLKESIEVNTFEKSYTMIDKVLFGFAILAHIASIIFGYIFVYHLLNSSTDEFWGKQFIVPLITLISLTSFEVLKRFLFRQTSLNFLIKRGITRENIGTGVVSLLLIVLTFYLSLNGAEQMGDRSKVVETNTEIKINSKADSISKVYDAKIAVLQKDKDAYRDLITTGTRSRELRSQYNALIEATNNDIKQLETEKAETIKAFQGSENAKADVQKKEITKNIFSFIIISSFIEIIILIGVWFNSYFEYRSFKEFSDKVQTQNNYKRFIVSEILLELVFNKGKVEIGAVLDSSKSLKRLSNIKGINVTEKQIGDFFTLTKHLKITETQGGRRVASKGYDDAKAILLDYYNVD